MGGKRTLARSSGRMDWPHRGVYFFFENGEMRSGSGRGPRVVRVGTHGLKIGTKSSLWTRLRTHRGATASGRGNHRGSIFRLLVGEALARREGYPLPPTWGAGGSPSDAAWEFSTSAAAVLADEDDLECHVSDYIGQMPLLWLEVEDEPGPESLRGVIERNALALLGRARPFGPDAPSLAWPGRFSSRKAVRTSGLWNSKHVSDPYDPRFLDAMEHLVEH